MQGHRLFVRFCYRRHGTVSVSEYITGTWRNQLYIVTINVLASLMCNIAMVDNRRDHNTFGQTQNTPLIRHQCAIINIDGMITNHDGEYQR